MQAQRISRARDFLTPAPRPAATATDLAPLVGTWVNFDVASRGIARVEIADRDGELIVRAWGTGSPEPCDWGETVGEAFTDGVALHAAVAFRAVYDFGALRVMLACYLNKRLLVVDAYSVFQDGSGRSPYFQRDHFYQR
ncbi:MAG TPA: hypothetical protein VGX68_09550 [Thermoanaerobaculia bacterium]|nr:hypothetical protein [Thermoanaerobaculia bacterium]